MNTNQLYIEYARVIKMCEGTALEDKPWECVKVKVCDGVYKTPNNAVDMCQNFYNNKKAIFAVAILEDKPVFIGDIVYGATSGNEYDVYIKSNGDVFPDFEYMGLSWHPPKPKRTFTLNGVELPCPVLPEELPPGICNYFKFIGRDFYFESKEDRDKTCESILNLLTEARDKG